MILILIGKSCSGKTEIRERLYKNYGYEKIITTTDRPPRPKERNGIDYDFVAPEVFTQLEQSNYFCETTSYNVANNSIWRYGTPYKAFKSNISNKLRVIILNPQGLKSIQYKISKNNYCVCYITADYLTIRRRMVERGDNMIEGERRILADNADFINIKSDIIIPNYYIDDIDKVTRDIHQFYQFWRSGKE